nr:YdhK family protein [Mesobacillus harenae]
MKKWMMGIIALLTAFSLTACGAASEDANPDEAENNQTEEQGTDQTGTEEPNKEEEAETGHGGHGDMDHSGSGEVPEGLKEAENPTYEVGSKAKIEEGHMGGMEGAEATIVGAYDTTVYAVSYDPTTGGERVEKHKWVVHEEIKDAGEQPYEPGDEVTLEAEHMAGMGSAKAEIDTAEQTTVYMIDFTPTDGSDKVTNHQWVTEAELSPAE